MWVCGLLREAGSGGIGRARAGEGGQGRNSTSHNMLYPGATAGRAVCGVSSVVEPTTTTPQATTAIKTTGLSRSCHAETCSCTSQREQASTHPVRGAGAVTKTEPLAEAPPRLATSGHTCFAPPPLREDLNSVPRLSLTEPRTTSKASLSRLSNVSFRASSPRLAGHKHRLPRTSRNARWPRQAHRRLKSRARVHTCDHPASSLAERLPRLRFVRVGADGQGSASRSPITF